MLAAVLLRGALEAAPPPGQQGQQQQGGSPAPPAPRAPAPAPPVALADHPLLASIHAALDPGGRGSAAQEVAAVEAAGGLGLSARGAEALLLEASQGAREGAGGLRACWLHCCC